MAQAHVIAVMGAILFTLLVLYQVATVIALPDTSIFNLAFGSASQQKPNAQSPLYLNDALKKKQSDGSRYLLGVGKADITGPVVELEYMGYADLNQIGTGLRQRLYARSFIIGDPDNEADRFVYMVLDTQSGDTAIRYGILDGVKALGSDYAAYGQPNVAVTGTHSHSGPGAWLNYLLPTITSKGFDKQSYQAIVDGGVLSIKRAHESLTEGTLSYGEVELQDANINRSPYAYLANPEDERAQYSADVDKFMTMLKFTRASDGKDMGVLSWFPVHGTSMLGNNTYASGDNKGVAMDLFEKSVKGADSTADGFVAGFSQTNVGDTSPNILGAWCEDGTNVQCTFERSLCSGVTENCHGRGPNFTVPDNGATSCLEIGTRQFKAAKSLYDDWSSKGTAVSGDTVKAFHTFQDMRGYNFTLANGTEVSTCAAALGNSFAAGTSDWPGAFDFKQGDNGNPDNPFWNVVGGLLHPPTEEQKKCQGEKPVLLDVGNVHTPYDWAPNIVDIQVMRAGQFYFIIAPGEATTMSGRRWKKAIVDAAKDDSDAAPYAVIGGPSNTYAHYIATPEEYNVQRYEGASTLFGPFTLDAYINLTTTYLPYLSSNPPSEPLAAGPSPPNNVDKALSFITGVVYDNAPIGKKFGDVLTDLPATTSVGSVINATFVGANPRNDLRLEQSYATVEQQSGSAWNVVRDDSDWELVFGWNRTNGLTGTSTVTITWHVPSDVAAGSYRVKYYGASKAPITGTISQFNGTSGVVKVG